MASTIKVDNVQNQPGNNLINRCSATTTIGSGAGNTVVVCGSTVTLGRCGGSVALASGATQTGFGRTGTVDWQTGSIKTTTFTAVSGEGYFVNTTGGAVTVNLPAGSAGDIVGLKDYAGTWQTNAVTLNPNGSDKIGGGNAADPTLGNEGGSILLVYVDGTQGWLTTQESVTTSPTGVQTFITASGGTIVTSGDFKTHIFTGPGTFTVCCAASSAPNNRVDYVVIAGGGSGGNFGAGGGGAGGFRLSNAVGCVPAPTTSPLVAPNSPTCGSLPVSATSYPIVVGGGGTAGTGTNTPGAPNTDAVNGQKGSNASFSTITSAGGGGGSAIVNCWAPSPLSGGGSGGASKGSSTSPGDQPGNAYPVGAGNTPPVSPPQGNNGGGGYDGKSVSTNGGGGGGAGAVGATTCTADTGAVGGIGSFVSDTFIGPPAPSYGEPGPVGSSRYFAAGGGGGTDGGNARPGSGGAGGTGGGGNGGGRPNNTGMTSATANTGSGGGGGGTGQPATPSVSGGGGGSGIVMIRYKFQ
jgi:hypothetical protein